MKEFIKKHKNIINVIILILVTLLVLYFALKDDFNEIIDRIMNVNIFYLLLAFLMVILYWLLRSLALHTFTKQFKSDSKYSSSLQCILRTQFFNAITPFATGGQPYQIYFLASNGISPTVSTSIIIQNFIVYQIALVLFGVIAVVSNFTFHIFDKVALLQHLVLLGFVCNTAVIILMFILSFSKKINRFLVNIGINFLTKIKVVKNKDKQLEDWNNRINRFQSGAKRLLKNKTKFIMTVLYNILALAFLYSIPLIMLYGMGDFESFNLSTAIITSAYVMLVGSFVPIPGASGGIEYSFMSFYGTFISGAKLKAIMLLWRFATYYFGLIVGAIALNIKKVK